VKKSVIWVPTMLTSTTVSQYNHGVYRRVRNCATKVPASTVNITPSVTAVPSPTFTAR